MAWLPRRSGKRLHTVMRQAGVDTVDAALHQQWEGRAVVATSPHSIKQIVLLSNGLEWADWVENGICRMRRCWDGSAGESVAPTHR